MGRLFKNVASAPQHKSSIKTMHDTADNRPLAAAQVIARSDFRQIEGKLITATLAVRVATIAWRRGEIDDAVQALKAAEAGIEDVLHQVGER